MNETNASYSIELILIKSFKCNLKQSEIANKHKEKERKRERASWGKYLEVECVFAFVHS